MARDAKNWIYYVFSHINESSSYPKIHFRKNAYSNILECVFIEYVFNGVAIPLTYLSYVYRMSSCPKSL